MGWNNQNTTQLLIVNAGSGFTGVFVYSPGPGAGNLISSMAATSGTDPYGNAYQAGITVYQQGNPARFIELQGNAGGTFQAFASGAASEKLAAGFSSQIFSLGGAGEQIAFAIDSAEGSASPLDRVTIEMVGSPANAAGSATGFVQYTQAGATPPLLVQSAQGTSSGGTSTTVTLGANTTVGNTLVVTVQGDSSSGPDPSVSGITLGGGADHFASVATASGAVTSVYCWYDPNIGVASTSVVVTTTAATGARVNVEVAEFSGLLTPTSVDQTATNPNGAAGTPFTSTVTGGLALVGEIAVGIAATHQTGGTLTGPAAPWSNFAQISNGAAISLTGWLLTSSLSGVAYAGSFATNPGGYAALIATFKPTASTSGVLIRGGAWGRQGWGGLLVNKNISTVPASNPAVAETWHNLSLNAGFTTTAGFHTPRYQYEAMNGGRTRLSGVVSLTANQAAAATIATLPAGYRPTTSVDLAANNNLSGALNSPIQITSAGAINLGGAATNGNFVSLDGMTFELD